MRYCEDSICINFYDSCSKLIGGDKNSTEGYLCGGEIQTLFFKKPSAAKSYRVWCPRY